MPLTAKGESILKSMRAEYGSKKGEQVFYASKNAGKISGVDCDMDQRDFNRAKAARDFKLERDMSPEEFSRLRELLDEWVEEEAEEPEHQQDEAKTLTKAIEEKIEQAIVSIRLAARSRFDGDVKKAFANYMKNSTFGATTAASLKAKLGLR